MAGLGRRKSTKRFGKYPGRVYNFAGSFIRKSDAQGEASRHRRREKQARVTSGPDGYDVWVRVPRGWTCPLRRR